MNTTLCWLADLNEVINDVKIKTSVTSAVKNVPMSDTTNIHGVEILARDVFDALLGELKKAVMSPQTALTAQLCMYVNFYDVKCFQEAPLCLLPLKGHTTGENFF